MWFDELRVLSIYLALALVSPGLKLPVGPIEVVIYVVGLPFTTVVTYEVIVVQSVDVSVDGDMGKAVGVNVSGGDGLTGAIGGVVIVGVYVSVLLIRSE